MVEKLSEDKQLMLDAIENVEAFWPIKRTVNDKMTFVPRNEVRLRMGLPTTTPEEILERRKQIIQADLERRK